MTSSLGAVTLRPYQAADEEAAITLWRHTWQVAYPAIDFAAREAWWRARWATELVPCARIVVAERGTAMLGFVTIDGSGYLDQLVVGPEAWGTEVAANLMDEAKRLSPAGITLLVNADNGRAIGFYRKHGFADDGADVNPTSGRPVKRMRWTP